MPKLGATPLGYQIAEQFGHQIVPTRAGLVPLTLQQADKSLLAGISGVSVAAVLANKRNSFNESLLFTHRGISGPAVLQLSSYWQPGEAISINLDPTGRMAALLVAREHAASKGQLSTLLAQHLPKRVVQVLLSHQQLPNKPLYQYHPKQLQQIAATLTNWQLQPNGTEGYRTAEVTLGGVSTEQLSSKTMASKLAKGLYFIGEVVDVTGWLGGTTSSGHGAVPG
jgi:predicted Rossmann fold flavoprotein